MSAIDNEPDVTTEGQTQIPDQKRFNTLLDALRAVLDDPSAEVAVYEFGGSNTAHG